VFLCERERLTAAVPAPASMNLPSKYPRSEYDPWRAIEGFEVQGQGQTRERGGGGAEREIEG
jgi:hypothetical protein